MDNSRNLLVLLGILVFTVSTAIQAGLIVDMAALSARLTKTGVGDIHFCVEDLSIERVSHTFNIQEGQVLSGIETVQVNVSNYISSENVTVYYTLTDRTGGLHFNNKATMNVLGEGMAQFLYHLNTIDYPERNCFYSLEYNLHTNRSSCIKRYSAFRDELSINNFDSPPRWEQFRNENSTDLDAFSSWVRISDITLFKEDVGRLEFGGYWNFDDADLDAHIIFDQKRFAVSPNHLYCFHRPIFVTFFNFTWPVPMMYKNGVYCDGPEDGCELIDHNTDENTVSYQLYAPGNFEFLRILGASVRLNVYSKDEESEEYYINQNFVLEQDIFFHTNYTVSGEFINFSKVNCSLAIIDRDDGEREIARYGMDLNISRAVYYEARHYSFIDHWINVSSSSFGIGSYLARAECNASDADPDVPFRQDGFQFYVDPYPVDVAFWSETQPLETNSTNFSESIKKQFSIGSSNRKIRYNNDTPLAFISVAFKNKTSSELQPLTNHYECFVNWGDGTQQNITLNTSDMIRNLTVCDPLGFNCTEHIIAEIPHSFEWPGDYVVSINCGLIEGNLFSSFSGQTAVNITNRRPLHIHPIPDVTWLQGRQYSPFHLDWYFFEPDGEKMTFSVTNPAPILVYINQETSLVELISDDDFSGTVTVYFTATDPWGAYATSNPVNLTVIPFEKEETKEFDEDDGLYGEELFLERCQEKWNCTEWGPCLPSEIQLRTCVDMESCNTTFNKPPEWRFCFYTPTCYDGLKNQGELGVDCGGPCSPCPSCNDGIKNQGEEGIDCGGPCPPCPTCYDGIQNCHIMPDGNILCEEGIDCGGPCPPCVDEQRPGIVRSMLINHLNEFLIFGALAFLAASILLIAASKIPKVALFLSKAFDKMLNALTLPTFKEFNLYTEIMVKLSNLEKYFEKGKRDVILSRIDSTFKKFSGFLFSCPEGSTEQEVIEKASQSSLREADKMLIELFLTKLSLVKYSGDVKSVSKARLRDLLVKLKLIVMRSKDLLYKVQVEKELDAIRVKMSSAPNARSLAESRLLYNIIRETYLFSGYVETKKLKNALQAYENIQKLYKQLRWWNRIKVYPRIAPRARMLKEMMRKNRQK